MERKKQPRKPSKTHPWKANYPLKGSDYTRLDRVIPYQHRQLKK